MIKKSRKDEGIKSTKVHGRIYTPDYLVRLILDYVGYTGKCAIIKHHIIDNSCGDGAFLAEIVKRYCENYKGDDLGQDLATYIHGIEIDADEHKKCIERLNSIVEGYGSFHVEWDVRCGDTLLITDYNQKMDYVVGNPPYVRVHNLETSYQQVKNFTFAQHGMTDLFIVFFEIGFNMLSDDGKMCIITPSSWLSSGAGRELRKYISLNHNLDGLIDLEHFQPFSATTYTLIARTSRRWNESINYSVFDEGGLIERNASLSYDDFIINDKFYLADVATINNLREILCGKYPKAVEVKNGFATLADKIFIGDFQFDGLVINVLKASTGEWKKCIFPYDENGKILSENQIIEYISVYRYLEDHKEELERRSIDHNGRWYGFGRSQAINDVYKDKIAINTLLKEIKNIRLSKVGKGEGVYSGLYIISNQSFDTISEILLSEDFIIYVKALKNYKNGGYYTFSSQDLERYINYKISLKNEQSRVSTNSEILF